MLTIRTRRRADRGARAVKQLAAIEAEVAALSDEDLLDLADIFVSQPASRLGGIALAQMTKRGISL